MYTRPKNLRLRRGKTWDQAEEILNLNLDQISGQNSQTLAATFWVIGCWCPETGVIVGRAASHEAALKELNLKVAC